MFLTLQKNLSGTWNDILLDRCLHQWAMAALVKHEGDTKQGNTVMMIKM